MGLWSFFKSLLFGSGSKRENADEDVIIENTDVFRTTYDEYDETKSIQVAKKSNKTRPSLHVLQNQVEDIAKHTDVEKYGYSFTNKETKERPLSENSNLNLNITSATESYDFKQENLEIKPSFSEIDTTSDVRNHQISHKRQYDSTSNVSANQNKNLVEDIQESSGIVRQENFSEKKYYDTSTGKLETLIIVPETDNATREITNVKVEVISSINQQQGNEVGTIEKLSSFDSPCKRNSGDQVESKFEKENEIIPDNKLHSKTTHSKHHEKTDSFGKIIQEFDDNINLYETAYDKSEKDECNTDLKQHKESERNIEHPSIDKLTNNKSALEYGFTEEAKSLSSFEIIQNEESDIFKNRYEHSFKEAQEDSQKTERDKSSLASCEKLETSLKGLAEISNSIPTEVSSKPQEGSQIAKTGISSLDTFENFDKILEELNDIPNDNPNEVFFNPQEQNIIIKTTNEEHSFMIVDSDGNREKEPSSMIKLESFSRESDNNLDKNVTDNVKEVQDHFPEQTPGTKEVLRTSSILEEHHISDVVIENSKACPGPLNALASEFKPRNDINFTFNIKEDETANQLAADQLVKEKITVDHNKVDPVATDRIAANQVSAADQIIKNQVEVDRIATDRVAEDHTEANLVQTGESQDTGDLFIVSNENELSDHAKACRRTLDDIYTRVQNVASRIETIFVDDDDYYNYTEQLLALSIEVDAVKSNREQVIRGWKKLVLKKIHQFEDRAEVKLKEFNNS